MAGETFIVPVASILVLSSIGVFGGLLRVHVDDLGATVTRVLQCAQAVPRMLHRLILFLAKSCMRVYRWQLKLLVTSLLSVESGSLGSHSSVCSRAYSTGSAYTGGCFACGPPYMFW